MLAEEEDSDSTSKMAHISALGTWMMMNTIIAAKNSQPKISSAKNGSMIFAD